MNTKTCHDLGVADEKIVEADHIYYDPKEEPFRIYGLWNPTAPGRFLRMPQDVAEATSPGVKGLSNNPSGGRIRFVTDSGSISCRVFTPPYNPGSNMCTIGRGGIDVYMMKNGRQTFVGVLKPPAAFENGYEAMLNLPRGRKELTLNLPIHTPVNELWLGLDKGASLERHPDYRIEKPVFFYGSSITNGSGASRPGMIYESIISRRLDVNFVNFGFSGNCKAEDAICDYMAALDYSVFVLDYDHNAPSLDHLRATHEKCYLKIRAAHPDVPIVIVTKPDFVLTPGGSTDRRDIIYDTYRNALKRGERVIFVDGQSLFQGEMREDCTVDGCHPNDLGMTRMADVIGKAVDCALMMVEPEGIH